MNVADLSGAEEWVAVGIAAAGALAIFFLVIAAYLIGRHEGQGDLTYWIGQHAKANERANRAERRLRQRPLQMRERPIRPSYAGHRPVLPRPERLPMHSLGPWQDPTVEIPEIRTLELAVAR